MPRILVARALVLDSADTDGLSIGYSSVLALDGHNAAQVECVLFVQTATSVSVLVQRSHDRFNWSGGKGNTVSAIGRKLLDIEGSLGAPFLRLKISINGTGKAIMNTSINLSAQ